MAADPIPKLREGGFRLTPQRAIILETIAHARGHGHLTAQEVFQLAKKRLPGLNLATVYRTLETLHEAGLIDHMTAGVGETRFSLHDPKKRHGHLVCRKCETELVIDMSVAKELAERIEAEHGFAIEMEHLSFAGICAACKRKASRR